MSIPPCTTCQRTISKVNDPKNIMTMAKKLFTAILLVLAFSSLACAQTTDEQKKEINRIKKNTAQYLYAEVTTNDKQTALDLAEESLYAEINKYVAKKKSLNKAANIVTRNTHSAWETITLPRGNMYRAFVYVKKSDIIPADNATVTEVPKTEEPKSQVESLNNYDATVSRLLQINKFAEFEGCLKQLKQEGRIQAFGKYKTLTDPTDYVLIIYNQAGDIEAVLSEGTARKNLRTGVNDSVVNYKGRGAFGVKINKN